LDITKLLEVVVTSDANLRCATAGGYPRAASNLNSRQSIASRAFVATGPAHAGRQDDGELQGFEALTSAFEAAHRTPRGR
jgi:hypothetical protein